MFYLTNKETSKGWVCVNFLDNFIFFWVPSMKNKFKYFKNLTVKVVLFGAMRPICLFFTVTFFWWKLIDRNFFNPIFNTKVVLRASPLFYSFHCFARDYLQTGYSDMLDISYLFNNNTHKCIKAKIFPFNQK